MRKVETEDATLNIKPEWVDPSLWPEVVDMATRLQMAEAGGIRNPFFAVHDGTARNTTSIGGKEFVNYSSYNYVGLSGDDRVLDAVKKAVDQYGTSVSASRVASGERPFHGELEAELARSQGAEDSLVFTAGHATNVTTVGHLFGPDDIIFHDELIHDSLLQGIKLSGSARRAFRHDDANHLEQQLRELRGHYKRCLIVVEGVYSMDGDVCSLPDFVALKKKYGTLLMVDEAHSFGVIGATGRGVSEHYGIDGSEIDLWMGTLSKSLASCGGWIAGSKAIIGYLRYTAPGFVYSAGITPANGVAALTSLRLMLKEPWRVEKLQANARTFHDALTRLDVNTGPAEGASAVIPAVTGNSMHALMLSQRLNDQGVNVQPIVYPAVADDSARLRFFLSSTHTADQLVWTAERVANTLAGVQADFKLK
jgi:8-amino-7-oxononanoate synthase